MIVHVNGTPRELPDGVTVAQLLEVLGLAQQACAVEVNRTLVPKRSHPDARLAQGDTIEIVTLVGGG